MELVLILHRLAQENSDIATSILIPIVIGIFAFALPLLLQTAARIDEKYNSTLLIKVFRQDWICRCFLISLLVSILFCILWALQLPRCVNWGECLNMLLDNSSLILLLLSTTILIVCTVCIVWLIYVYYLPERLLERLIKQYRKATNEDKIENLFRAIGYIFLYSIRTENESLPRVLYDFYEQEFEEYRRKKIRQPIKYPDYYYDVLFDANECLCSRERKSISWYRRAFAHFPINLSMQNTISEETYSFLWRSIRQYLFYEKDEYVFSYWQIAHLYASIISNVQPRYDYSSSQIIMTNQEEVDFWDKEKERFLEFHYAVGGLLMSKQKYNLIRQLMSWSTSIPPHYYLVPETISRVINQFMKVSSNEKTHRVFYYEGKYPFPDVQGVTAEGVIQMWIKRYLAILFLRQYIADEDYPFISRLRLPASPTKLSEKERWIDELKILRHYVAEYLDNQDILETLGMEILRSVDWYKKTGKVHPLMLIDNFVHQIEHDSEKTKQEQPIAVVKKEKFEDETKRILSEAFEVGEIFLQQGEASSKTKLVYRGQHLILDKAAFANDSDVSYVNEDTITAEYAAQEFTTGVINIFLLMNSVQYKVRELDLFKAVDRLPINEKDYVILNAGLHLKYYHDYLQINGLVEHEEEMWQYKGVEIIRVPSNQIINCSFIVIKKKDLPFISFNDVNNELVEKYDLVKIDERRKIYTNLLDFNGHNELLDETSKDSGISKAELQKKVLACVDFCAVVSCKPNAKCLQLNVYSHFSDSANPINIEEIKTPW